MSSRIHNSFMPLLAAICLAGGLVTPVSVDAAETGVRGTVLWGPVNPGPARVGQNRVGQSDEAPFAAAFIVFNDECQVARFKSDKQGKFEVALTAGQYTIVPDKSTPIPAPLSQAKSVTVPVDGFAEVILRFDTGMK